MCDVNIVTVFLIRNWLHEIYADLLTIIKVEEFVELVEIPPVISSSRPIYALSQGGGRYIWHAHRAYNADC